MHDIALMFLGVPEVFGWLFGVGEKVFGFVEEGVGEVELFVLELLHFDDLFGAFWVLGAGVWGKQVFEFCAEVADFVFHYINTFRGDSVGVSRISAEHGVLYFN